VLADSAAHKLCAGGPEADRFGDHRPRMETDSEALLHAGVALAKRTWARTRQVLNWTNESVTRVFTHQVGRQHRTRLMEELELDPALDFPTVEFLGNTGAAALPMALSLGLQQKPPAPHERMALLGIGSGLNSIMLGLGSRQ
jgi:3-oxoacyl-[acyl-carrier-protein] synthase-3